MAPTQTDLFVPPHCEKGLGWAGREAVPPARQQPSNTLRSSVRRA